jgi:hypothetical protein
VLEKSTTTTTSNAKANQTAGASPLPSLAAIILVSMAIVGLVLLLIL